MLKEWLRIARRKSIVARALKYRLVVGSILIVNNHGNAIASNTVDFTRLIQMSLTLLVPYCVSTASSVAAIIDHCADTSKK